MNTYNEKLEHLITEALKEDVGDGDHSTLSCIPVDQRGKAVLKIKQEGVLAGMQVAEKIFKLVEAESVLTPFKSDGNPVANGDIAFTVEARIHTILQCERLVLN